MDKCANHPGKKAYSICRGCGKHYCMSCLDEGKEFYYCRKPTCHELLTKETGADLLPTKIICPDCSSELELTDKERSSKKIHCPVCEAFLDYNSDPPRILKTENFSPLLSTMNQGDVALLESILDNADLDYYVYDAEFLSVRPLVQPTRFFVATRQLEEAQALIKDLDLHVFGVSGSSNLE
ncbi:MAG TPA: hypothetical protein VIS48_13120 [Candidatus Kryptonia bacterium]